jgi:hypothetical protein
VSAAGCKFAGCGRAVRTMGYCNGHYLQSWRGQELKPLRTVVYASLAERMEAHTVKSDGCWTWSGAVCRAGYGQIGVEGTVRRAHRVAYELARGHAIPEGMEIDHMCHTPACVRPDHLRLATSKQNKENRQGAQPSNPLGIRGVHLDKRGRYVALVGHLGRTIRVGRYRTAEEAEAAVIAKRNELFTHNLRDRIAS